MIVLDASAVVDLLIESPLSGRVESAIRDEELWSPQLLDAEVVSAVWRQVRAGRMAVRPAENALDKMRAMPITRVNLPQLTARVWQLRDRVWIFDAFYVACAEFVRCPLLTTDARLGRAPLPGVTITLVS